MSKAPPTPRKSAAPKPSPAPAPTPAPAAETAASEGDTATPAPTPAAQDLSAPAPATPAEAGAAIAEEGSSEAPLADAQLGDDRHELLGTVERAIRHALDALDDVARSGVFFAETPADRLIVATAQQGFDAMRKVMTDTEQAIAVAVSTLRYEGLERRAFVLVADVQLDGTAYGPGAEDPTKPAPLTADQHAELSAVGAVDLEWAEGASVDD